MSTEELKTVFVCYGNLNPDSISGYKYVILEPHFYSEKDVEELKKTNQNVFAYLSLGEVNRYSKFYEKVKPFTIGTNKNWGSLLLNLESEVTTTVLAEEIDRFVRTGYTGVFYDNLDNFGSFGQQTNQQNQLIAFIKNIKSKYPNHLFIQNSGVEFIELTHPLVDALVFESVASHFNFETKSYHLRIDKEFETRKNSINKIQEKYKIPVLIIEYADTKEGCTRIKKRLNPDGFMYFVGKIDLQTAPDFK